MIIFEHHKQPLISRYVFIKRILLCVLISAILLIVTIMAGATVYHQYENLSWNDAILNAVTVLTGLGFIVIPTNEHIKTFTSFYALFSTVIFFMVLAILFSPMLHRFLHHFHLEIDKK